MFSTSCGAGPPDATPRNPKPGRSANTSPRRERLGVGGLSMIPRSHRARHVCKLTDPPRNVKGQQHARTNLRFVPFRGHASMGQLRVFSQSAYLGLPNTSPLHRLLNCLPAGFQKQPPIMVTLENVLPAIAALHDMLDGARILHAHRAPHGRKFTNSCAVWQKLLVACIS